MRFLSGQRSGRQPVHMIRAFLFGLDRWSDATAVKSIDNSCIAMPDDPQLDALKLPPHSLEAEQSVLGGLLLDNEAADRVGDVVADADFYSEAHRLIYAHIMQARRRRQAGGRRDGVRVARVGAEARLHRRPRLSRARWCRTSRPPRTSATTRSIVRDRSILRQLAATAGDIADSAYNPLGRSAKEVLDQAEAKVLHIAEQGARGAQQFAAIGTLLAERGRAHRDALQPRRSVGRHRRADGIRRSRPR